MNEKVYIDKFLDFRPQLKSFLFRILTNRQDCEDVLQETYLKFTQNLHSFRGESSFKTWVFTIAVNLARNHLKQQTRWGIDYQDKGRDLHMADQDYSDKMKHVFFADPDANLEIQEHLDYCFTCISKTLELTQQVCLFLKDVYGFKQKEIEDITGLSEGKVKHGITDARKNMMHIFDNRCALINKQGVCDQCTAIKGYLNPKQDAHALASQLDLVKESDSASRERLMDLRLEIVRSIDPINKPSSQVHIYFLENLPQWAQIQSS